MKSITPKPLPVAPAPAPAKKTFLYVVIGFFILFLFSIGFVVFSVQRLVGKATGTSFLQGSADIDLIEIEGPIYQSDDLVRRIKRFRKGSKKALILRLNSPGGAVAPSQEIYDEVLSARRDGKIVVASMSSLAASGAYYIASACDQIVADPGTLTASIGVIAEFPDASGLLRKVGVNFQTIKSGKFKDTGTFNRPMNPQEREYLQETINDVFEQFLGSVIDGRRAPIQKILAPRLKKKPSDITDQQIKDYLMPYADGRVVTGQKALALGLVDKLGNYYDAVRLTADLAGIKGEPTVHLDEPAKIEQFLKNLTPFNFLSQDNMGFQLEYRAF